MGDAVAGNVFSADRYELARIRSDGSAVQSPKGHEPRWEFILFLFFLTSEYVSVLSVLSVFAPLKRRRKICVNPCNPWETIASAKREPKRETT